jgi:hypothetical protein
MALTAPEALPVLADLPVLTAPTELPEQLAMTAAESSVSSHSS